MAVFSRAGFSLIAVLAFAQNFAFAKEVENSSKGLLDSYVIAKSDEHQAGLTSAEMEQKPYTIHVVSYINEKDAKSHVEELKVQEKDAYYVPAFVRGQVWYKVCVGKFVAKEEAEKYRKTFMKRMDEPLSTVISLVDDGGEKEKKRSIASVTDAPAANEKAAAAPVTKDVPVMAAPKVATTTAPVAESKPAAVKVPATAGEFYSIQVGAFETEKIAKAKVDAIPVKDQDIFFQEATVNGQKWYRVLVGKFQSKKDAEAYQVALKSQPGGVDGFVRRIKDAE